VNYSVGIQNPEYRIQNLQDKLELRVKNHKKGDRLLFYKYGLSSFFLYDDAW
jgi:hypothetical protein